MHPQKPSEHELIDINKGSSCDKKDEGVPEEVMRAKKKAFKVKEL